MGSLLMEKDKINYKTIILSAVVFLIALATVFPFIFMISATFKPQAMITAEPLKLIPDVLYLKNYELVFAYADYFRWYFNSIWMVLVTLALRVFIVTMAAYAFARLKMPGKNVLFVAVFSVWMIPADTTLVGRYLFYKSLHLTGSPWSVIFNFTFDVFMLFMIRQFFMQVPMYFTEAALIDGCSHFKIYYKIMFPLCKPALITMSLFTFIWVWNSFTEPFIFIDMMNKQMLTVGLTYFQSVGGADLGMILAGACIGTFPTIILFTLSQKFFVQGIAGSGIKG